MSLPPNSKDQVDAPLEGAAKQLIEPFRDFANAQSASGWVLLGAAAIAIVLANSPLSQSYFAIIHADLAISLAGASLSLSLQHWVSDGLMAIFFFLLGLELKRDRLADTTS